MSWGKKKNTNGTEQGSQKYTNANTDLAFCKKKKVKERRKKKRKGKNKSKQIL